MASPTLTCGPDTHFRTYLYPTDGKLTFDINVAVELRVDGDGDLAVLMGELVSALAAHPLVPLLGMALPTITAMDDADQQPAVLGLALLPVLGEDPADAVRRAVSDGATPAGLQVTVL